MTAKPPQLPGDGLVRADPIHRKRGRGRHRPKERKSDKTAKTGCRAICFFG